MKQLLIGDCRNGDIFHAEDPDMSEEEFQFHVAKALGCLYGRAHTCIVYTGPFHLDGDVRIPDLALIANDRSHWFLIEVELASHSFDLHVLPQVRAFRYGEPTSDAVIELSRNLGMDMGEALWFLRNVPRNVLVIANRRKVEWEIALKAHDIQLMTALCYKCIDGERTAIEIEGRPEASAELLGFGVYSATDRTLRCPKNTDLPAGTIQVLDLEGLPGLWTVFVSDTNLWISKDQGVPSILDGAVVQIRRSLDGVVSLRI